MAQPEIGFRIELQILNQIGKDSLKNFQNSSTVKKKLLHRVLCNEVCRLPNETIKQLAVRIETLKKSYSLNTHDYKNTKKDKNFNDDSNTSITKNSYKKSMTSSRRVRRSGGGGGGRLCMTHVLR